MTTPVPTYQRSPYGAFPVRLSRAEGVCVYDAAGREWLDCCAGWGAVSCGHNHPLVQARLHAALDTITASAYLKPPMQDEAVERLNGVLPQRLGVVALYSTGAEAIDFSLRLARAHTGRGRFIAFRGHFHGKTHGGMYLLGSVPESYGPRPEDYVHLLDTPTDNAPETLQQFGAALEAAQAEGPVAGVILEPVIGYSGPDPVPHGVLQQVRNFCTKHGALMMVDEVFTSIFRCGAWFECGAHDIQPDILIFGKGMGNGIPVAGVAATAGPAGDLLRALPGSTYAGNGLAWAASLGVLECLSEDAETLPGNVAHLERMARDWAQRSAVCAEHGLQVNGKGAMIGLRLREDTPIHPNDWVLACLEEGVMPSHAQRGLRLTPPVIMRPETWREALCRIEAALMRLGAAGCRGAQRF